MPADFCLHIPEHSFEFGVSYQTLVELQEYPKRVACSQRLGCCHAHRSQGLKQFGHIAEHLLETRSDNM